MYDLLVYKLDVLNCSLLDVGEGNEMGFKSNAMPPAIILPGQYGKAMFYRRK